MQGSATLTSAKWVNASNACWWTSQVGSASREANKDDSWGTTCLWKRNKHPSVPKS